MIDFKKCETMLDNFAQWGIDRNFHGGATWQGQLLKTVEEKGELFQAYVDGNLHEFKDGIGDIVVTLIMFGLCKDDWAPDVRQTLRDAFEVPLQDNERILTGYFQHQHSSGQLVAMNWAFVMESQFGAMVGHILKGRKINALIALSNAVTNLTLLAHHAGLDMQDCLEQAWNDIKERKGEWRDGVFVKEADL